MEGARTSGKAAVNAAKGPCGGARGAMVRTWAANESGTLKPTALRGALVTNCHESALDSAASGTYLFRYSPAAVHNLCMEFAEATFERPSSASVQPRSEVSWTWPALLNRLF